jgi:hypothetical protein
MGLGLMPAFATLWQRLTMPKDKKFLEFKVLHTPTSSASSVHYVEAGSPPLAEDSSMDVLDKDSKLSQAPTSKPAPPTYAASSPTALDYSAQPASDGSDKACLDTFFISFSEWRHSKP